MNPRAIVDAYANPERFFSRKLTYADAAVPLLVAMVIGVWLNHVLQPFVAKAVYETLPPEAAQRFVADSGARLTSARWLGDLGALAAPLILTGLVASLAFLALGAWFRLPRFESLTVGPAWALLALTFKDVAQYALLMARGLDSVRGPTDLVPGLGFGFLLANQSSVLYGVLELINGFDLGYVIFFAFAIRLAESIPFREALFATAIPWLLLQGVRLGFSSLFHS